MGGVSGRGGGERKEGGARRAPQPAAQALTPVAHRCGPGAHLGERPVGRTQTRAEAGLEVTRLSFRSWEHRGLEIPSSSSLPGNLSLML